MNYKIKKGEKIFSENKKDYITITNREPGIIYFTKNDDTEINCFEFDENEFKCNYGDNYESVLYVMLQDQ